MTAAPSYQRAIMAIDVENAGDPGTVVVDGVERTRAGLAATVAVDWAGRLAGLPSEPLLLAARAHRLGTWRVPRQVYPQGAEGRERWRLDHDRVRFRRLSRLLTAAGYGDPVIDRVVRLVGGATRAHPGGDPDHRHLVDAVAVADLVMGTTAPPTGDQTVSRAAATIARLGPVGLDELLRMPPVPAGFLEPALPPGVGLRGHPDPVEAADRLITRALAPSTRPAVTTSMQLGGLVLVHLIRRHHPGIPVVFVDTGYHFPETLAFRDRLAERWGLHLVVAAPDTTRQRHETEHGPMYATDPVTCCAIRKVAPADRALAGHDVWFTALRRDQAATRAAITPVERHHLSTGDPITKVNPLSGWTWRDLELYATVHDIPRHPLYEKGYTSIGCAPCTRATGGDGDDRSGRWDGTMIECGLHIDRSRVA